MIRRPPVYTRTSTLFPSPSLVRSAPLTDCTADRLIFVEGPDIPVVNHVPRFVPSDVYVKSFSFQWTQYQRIQHDSPYKAQLSQADLDRKSTRLNSSHYCATRMPPTACKQTNTPRTHTQTLQP